MWFTSTIPSVSFTKLLDFFYFLFNKVEKEKLCYRTTLIIDDLEYTLRIIDFGLTFTKQKIKIVLVSKFRHEVKANRRFPSSRYIVKKASEWNIYLALTTMVITTLIHEFSWNNKFSIILNSLKNSLLNIQQSQMHQKHFIHQSTELMLFPPLANKRNITDIASPSYSWPYCLFCSIYFTLVFVSISKRIKNYLRPTKF